MRSIAWAMSCRGRACATCGCSSPRAPDPDPTRASGWGLFLVDELADRWGVEPADPGTLIWFEIDR